MKKLGSAFFKCRKKGCWWNKKIEYASYGAMFSHYFQHGRDTLIELIKKEGISKNPYALPTYILADKLKEISRINREDLNGN